MFEHLTARQASQHLTARRRLHPARQAFQHLTARRRLHPATPARRRHRLMAR